MDVVWVDLSVRYTAGVSIYPLIISKLGTTLEYLLDDNAIPVANSASISVFGSYSIGLGSFRMSVHGVLADSRALS